MHTLSYKTYNSAQGWYDSDTHKYLGDYLRYLRDEKSLNLMPYYNCYNDTELTDVYIDPFDLRVILCSDDKVKDESGKLVPKICPKTSGLFCGQRLRYTSASTYTFGSTKGYKVVAVPVKFDTTYTVAVDSYSPVALRGIIYNKEDGMIKEYKKYPEKSSVTYYSDYLNHSFVNIPCSRFSDPFTYRIDLVSVSDDVLSKERKKELYSRRNDLYMILQLPSTVDSSIVVLEGDYTSKTSDNDVSFTQDAAWGNPHKLSLLYYNTGVSYAFSDRLIEYLLLNVISQDETLSTNIARVQRSISEIFPEYRDLIAKHRAAVGVWDDRISKHITDLINKKTRNIMVPFDHDGNINKDVEELLFEEGVYYT